MNFNAESAETDVPMQTTKQKPIQEVRLGSIKAAIWANQTEAGVRYNVTFTHPKKAFQ